MSEQDYLVSKVLLSYAQMKAAEDAAYGAAQRKAQQASRFNKGPLHRVKPTVQQLETRRTGVSNSRRWNGSGS